MTAQSWHRISLRSALCAAVAAQSLGRPGQVHVLGEPRGPKAPPNPTPTRAVHTIGIGEVWGGSKQGNFKGNRC